MMDYQRSFLFAVFLFFRFPLAFTQQYEWKYYGVDDGLPSTLVYRVVPDSKGFMWVLTDKSLARFDGKVFQPFPDADGINNNSHFAMGEDSKQRLWLYGPVNFFAYFDLNDNRFYRFPNTLSDGKKAGYTTFIFENDKGDLTFYNSNREIYYLDKNLKPVHKEELPLTQSLIQKNYPKVAQKVSYTKKNFKDSLFSLFTGDNLPAQIITYPYVYANTMTLTDSSFFYRKGLSIVAYKNGKSLEKKIADLVTKGDFEFKISETGKQNLRFVRTRKEYFVVDAQLNRLKEYDFLNDFNINSIYIDAKDNLWISTVNQGLIVRTVPLVKKMPKIIFPNMSVTSLATDSKGQLFVGNSEGEISTYQNGVEKKIKLTGAPRLGLYHLKFMQGDHLFVGWLEHSHTIIPPHFLYGSIIPKITFFDDLRSANIAKIPQYKSFEIPFSRTSLTIINHSEVKYFAQNTEGVLFYSIGRNDIRKAFITQSGWTSQLHTTSGAHGLVSDTLNDLWVSRYEGLSRWQNNTLDTLGDLKKQFPALRQFAQCIAKDAHKNLWLSTGKINLYHFNPQKKRLNRITEIKNDWVADIRVDAKNRAWISTNHGVCCVELLQEVPFKYRFTRIIRDNGLPTQDVYETITDSTHLYVGTPKGVVIFNISDLLNTSPNLENQQTLAIKSLKINGEETILRGYFDLPYDKNNLDIEFTSISFNNKNPLEYEYRLYQQGNTDTTWRKTFENRAQFIFLPSGQYKLEIRALHDNVIVSTLLEPLIFNILQPFWRTTGFLLSISGALGLAIFLFFKYNIRRITKQEEDKSLVQKRIANLEMQALQAQMNPHFVFNALTSIQNYIWNQDVKNANTYLTLFSKLMRQFLDSSRQKFVTLEEEMALIYNYVELEKMRFPNRFDVHIKKDEKLSKLTKIPSVMIQPFVENAINHGLLYKKEKGNLWVEFLKKDENTIVCIVEDDGVGRSNAETIQNQSKRTHRSQATQILKEKTDLLRQMADIKVDVTVTDGNQENSIHPGTKVTITIMLNHN
jgi:ligand-binding sensor domain-containing protein